MTEIQLPPSQSSPTAGFWARLLAFALDMLALGVAGTAIGLVFHEQLSSIGPWGRAVGFLIAAPYFGLMNSSAHGGQTLGKRALKLKVVSADGSLLTQARSLLRSAALCLPYFWNGTQASADLRSWLAAAQMLVVAGVGASTAYLFLFNRKTRQGIHDLIAGSFVVRADAAAPFEPGAGLWRGHAAVVAALLLLCALSPMFSARWAEKEPLASLLRLQKTIEAEPGVRSAGAVVGTGYFGTTQKGMRRVTYLSLDVLADPGVADSERLAARVAQVALESYPEAAAKDAIAVTLRRGYDIGIASGWMRRRLSYSPAQWQQRQARQ